MKTNKLTYALSAFLILGTLAFGGFALANDDRSGEDHGDSIQAKLARSLGSTLEVHISNNGKVLVRGAKVTSVSGSTINATTSWGALNMNWGVNVMSTTKMIRKSGGASSVSEVKVGDLVSFQGTLVGTSATPIMVNASIVKDWSIPTPQPLKTTVEGKIKSMATNSLVVTVGGRDYTVNIASDTSILNSLWLRSNLSLFKVGDGIRVYGVVDSTNSTIAATVIRDTSLR